MVTISKPKDGSCFGGQLTMSREFFNAATGDYIWLEAHEEAEEGQFRMATWVPGGNDNVESGSLRDIVGYMENYVPPAGFVEMAIPEGAL